MTDKVEVETSDHAKLKLELCYNWHFKVDQSNSAEVNKLFQVQDFIGNCCKNIASRIRGSVSGIAFEEWNKDNDQIIKKAVFGTDKDGNTRTLLNFKVNGLQITNIDLKNANPMDVEVKRSLENQRQVAMSMQTSRTESAARHKADVLK
jgi:major vault protein